MEYEIQRTALFKQCFKKLDNLIARRVAERVNILENSRRGIERLVQCPKDLQKLFKLKVGDWRVFLWVIDSDRLIILHAVWHRGDAYKKLFR